MTEKSKKTSPTTPARVGEALVNDNGLAEVKELSFEDTSLKFRSNSGKWRSHLSRVCGIFRIISWLISLFRPGHNFLIIWDLISQTSVLISSLMNSVILSNLTGRYYPPFKKPGIWNFPNHHGSLFWPVHFWVLWVMQLCLHRLKNPRYRAIRSPFL